MNHDKQLTKALNATDRSISTDPDLLLRKLQSRRSRRNRQAAKRKLLGAGALMLVLCSGWMLFDFDQAKPQLADQRPEKQVPWMTSAELASNGSTSVDRETIRLAKLEIKQLETSFSNSLQQLSELNSQLSELRAKRRKQKMVLLRGQISRSHFNNQ